MVDVAMYIIIYHTTDVRVPSASMVANVNTSTHALHNLVLWETRVKEIIPVTIATVITRPYVINTKLIIVQAALVITLAGVTIPAQHLTSGVRVAIIFQEIHVQ